MYLKIFIAELIFSLIRDELFEDYISRLQGIFKKDQSKLIANISNVTFDFSNNFLSYNIFIRNPYNFKYFYINALL